MRATISFETDVDQVEGTMAVLACSEEHNLRAAADFLSNFTVLDGSTLDVITEVLRLLDMSSEQLRQYRDMLVNFERAKFETMLPQPADQALVKDFRQVNEIKESMQKLDSFLGKVSEADHVDPEEG
jgi:hypothetical protein|tara:strand:- start:2398 stop:2778 length:381 start_codon:yes stop_codon:yes gene_type:complete